MARYILALDQGTTSSRAILFDARGAPVAKAQHEFAQHFPEPGWVEHDPEEIWQSQLRAARGVLSQAGAAAADVHAIGITNQRETSIVWERESGAPIYPAIVWQSRQSAGICEALKQRGMEDDLRRRSGLPLDSYFSASKLRFILDRVPGAQQRAERGELAFGTVDTWLLHKLSKGAVHATEPGNASRTMLYNLQQRGWDDELLAAFNLPRALLPELRPSSGEFGAADAEWLGAALPIAGVAGDQQAALFGQGCFARGDAKNTYGTGCFLLMNAGTAAPRSQSGLISTVAWQQGNDFAYALEGSVFVAGAAVQWLRDGLGLIENAAQSEALAREAENNGGVYLVPAFVGLGAPHWDARARGALVGITRGTSRAQVVRAALEAIAYQSRDVVECFRSDAGFAPDVLRVDGGACRNDFLMQFQADILGLPVRRPPELEVTALGAAALAGLATGFWEDRESLRAALAESGGAGAKIFEPHMPAAQREELYGGWQRAVLRAKDWARD